MQKLTPANVWFAGSGFKIDWFYTSTHTHTHILGYANMYLEKKQLILPEALSWTLYQPFQFFKTTSGVFRFRIFPCKRRPGQLWLLHLAFPSLLPWQSCTALLSPERQRGKKREREWNDGEEGCSMHRKQRYRDEKCKRWREWERQCISEQIKEESIRQRRNL